MTGHDVHSFGVPVSNPDMFWFGTLDDVHWFADPADDRYADDVELRWDRMVDPLASVTEALRAGDWTAHPDGGFVIAVVISGLSVEEESVIVSLFSGHPIQADPWDTELTDGRHRTWGFWSYDPGLVLPFESRLLGDEKIVGDPEYTPPHLTAPLRTDHRDEASEQLPQLPTGVVERSPRYVAALTRLARSEDVS
ncbi:hypothetical protein ACTJKO_00665 [Curtobacterium sp. 22159]|uniref:hypothetical protein n=1 Tax=Curtobacterium sp. 22159 TaxID=3453882 RepID=UPI003F842A69